MLLAVERTLFLLIVSAIALPAADPFLGNWKLDAAKSKVTGQMIRIAELAGNNYEFQEDEHTDVILADGLDHLTHRGETMAVTQRDARVWAITYKDGDRVLMDTKWEISADGQTLTYSATGERSNGLRFRNKLVAKRVAGDGKSLAGTWQSTDVALSSPNEIHISRWGADGERIEFIGRGTRIHLRFDDREYAEKGFRAREGATSSGHRIDDRTIQTTERIGGKIVETVVAAVSADGQTQTLLITEPGDPVPTLMVYQREPAGQ